MLSESKTERDVGSAGINNQTGLLEGVIKKTHVYVYVWQP